MNPSDYIKEAMEVRKETVGNTEYQQKIKEEIENQNRRIEWAKSNGRTKTCFVVSFKYEDVVKEMYIKKGYTFSPT